MYEIKIEAAVNAPLLRSVNDWTPTKAPNLADAVPRQIRDLGIGVANHEIGRCYPVMCESIRVGQVPPDQTLAGRSVAKSQAA